MHLPRSFHTVVILLALALVAVGCGNSDSGSAGDGHDHDHTESRTREWDTDDEPAIEISIDGDPAVGYTVSAVTNSFVFTGADVLDAVPGEGHAHLFIDGDLVTMAYAPTFDLPDLDPGTYEIAVSLSTNDHLDYVRNDEVIRALTTLVVPETETQAADEAPPAPSTTTSPSATTTAPPRLVIEVTIENGHVVHPHDRVEVPLGSSVVITVTSDAPGEVHLHGYDLSAGLKGGEHAQIAFIADVPGMFEMELEESGHHVLEIVVG